MLLETISLLFLLNLPKEQKWPNNAIPKNRIIRNMNLESIVCGFTVWNFPNTIKHSVYKATFIIFKSLLDW